jgi:hypothetical protein
VLSGSAPINTPLVTEQLISPMDAWIAACSAKSRKRPREDEDVNPDTQPVCAKLVAVAQQQQRMRRQVLDPSDFLMYSVIGALDVGNVGGQGQHAIEEYMTRWKMASRGSFPVPSVAHPVTPDNYEETILALQSSPCLGMGGSYVEWPVCGQSFPFHCQLERVGRSFFNSEFP